MFEVREQGSGKLLYSRGFSSVFAEWKTTDEAQHANRTFSESLRFPSPAGPVDVVKKRDEKDPSAGFHEVWKTTVDPKDKFVDRSRPPSPGPLVTLQKMGDSATKVDLLVLGDGYTAKERKKFEKDARRFMEMLFAASPFKEHRQDFNVWGLCPAAEESECRGLRAESIAGRRLEPAMTRSTANAMCSPPRIAPCAMSPLMPHMSSSKFW